MNTTAGYLIASMRIQQWIKNFFLFAALIFSGNLFNMNDWILSVTGFFLFAFVSSGIYIINDIADIEKDKLHPVKSKRPLPSGKLPVPLAVGMAVFLIAAGLVGGFSRHPGFGLILLLYVVLNIAYSFKFKEMVILDVMTIAAGFVLRVVSGAVIINVPISEWLIICTVLLSLFLGFSKRRHELTILEGSADAHRSVLQHYSPYFLDQMIGIVTASTVMSYTLYTISDETVMKFGTKNLVYTLPFVLYGIFRYLYLIHKKDEGGNPTRLALTDMPLLLNMVLWIMTSAFIIYKR
jgi:4-hydroxybenzoate polyprenyltransferase